MSRSFNLGNFPITLDGVFVPRLTSNTSRVQHGFLVIPGIAILPPDAAEVTPNNYIDMEEGSLYGGFDDGDYYAAAAEIFDDDATSIRPASKTAIEGLEKVRIDENFGKVGQCAVCLEELLVGHEARRLPCSHIYHPGCIAEWLKNSNTCPVCRHKMPVVDFDLNSTLPTTDP